MLTLEEFQLALPPSLKGQASEGALVKINKILDDPDMVVHFKENFLSFGSILASSRNTMEEYSNAIKYCTYKIAGHNNKDAYIKTFPDRYQNHVANGTQDKDIASYISAYNKTKLVTSILEQAYIPIWLVNQDAVQEAINTQVKLMRTAESEKVRCDAANSVLNHLKAPETHKIELDVGIKDTDSIDDLKNAVRALVDVQRSSIQSGAVTAGYVAHSKIIEHRAED